MKKQAKDLKKGDKIQISDRVCIIKEIETSDVGKHGTQKCRIIAETEDKEKILIIRPANYPFLMK